MMDELGPLNDRRLMIVGTNGKFLSQRALPQMALIKAKLAERSLWLEIPGQNSLEIMPSESSEKISVSVWGDVLSALEVGEIYSKSLSRFLGVDCRLVALDPSVPRMRKNSPMGFADSVPVLLTNEASLEALNRQLGQPVGMERFRPNIVIRGAAPFEEDSWERIQIGGAYFENIDPCTRCPVITVDQFAGVKQGQEPLRTLINLRGAKPTFGARLRLGRGGMIALGDKVIR